MDQRARRARACVQLLHGARAEGDKVATAIGREPGATRQNGR